MSRAPATALGQALSDKGFVKRNVELQIAISKFQNAGGEFGVAYAMLCAAFGHVRSDGQAARVDDDQTTTPANAASRGAGQGRGVGEDPSNIARRPGHSRRGATSIAAVQPALNKSLFDSIILPDGRPLRVVRWCDCPTLAARYQRISRVVLACRNYAVPADPTTMLGEMVPEDELQQIVEATERLNAIH